MAMCPLTTSTTNSCEGAKRGNSAAVVVEHISTKRSLSPRTSTPPEKIAMLNGSDSRLAQRSGNHADLHLHHR
jgi:hypothetical protein